MPKKTEKKKIGYLKYTEKLGTNICAQVAEGKGIREIFRGLDLNRKTWYDWLKRYEDLRKLYEISLKERAEVLGEETLDIADENPEYVVDYKGGRRVDTGWVQRQRLRVDTRKWMAAKLKPSKYGDSSMIKAEVKDTSHKKDWLDDILAKADKNARKS